MENKSKVVCTYKNANAYVMTCETEEAPVEEQPYEAPVVEERTITTEQPVEQPAEQPAAVQNTEEIAVPIVGDTEADASYAEPLGESTSWYPEKQSLDGVINYEYGTSSTYVASLTNPEVGFEASDILLIIMIALGCLAVVGSATILAGRAVSSRATRKDFVKK